MSEAVDRRIQDLSRAARMLAVIGASLKLRSSDAADPAIRELIDTGVNLALGDGVAALHDAQIAPLLTMIEMAFAEGGDLLRNPDRAAGWKVEDTQLLQAQGRASRNAFRRILALAATRPLLFKALEGTFLDVGTGVGGIALEAAETCSDLHVEGIDPWGPALALAERNVAASPHAARIRLSNLDVTALESGPRYTLVWLPTMFMKRAVVERALDRIVAASRSGAWLVASIYTQPGDPFMAVMSALRTLRGGGEVTEPSELEDMLRSRGYVDVESDAAPLATFVLGRRP
jgi:precorrin-6B methylase 2